MRCILFILCAGLQAQTPVFLEPVGEVKTDRAEVDGPPPSYRKVSGEKFLPWLQYDQARRALRLYETAHRLLEEQGNAQKQPRDYYIALVKGGNHASIGFRVQTEAGIEEHAKHAYILLDPAPWRFESTILHETGHVALAMLAGGVQLPRADVSSIPHSTATLSDRATAFSEGYAIHLETLAAHLATDPATRARFHHERVVFGGGPYPLDEYFRPAADLATYSQNVARYAEVRDNHFAFESAYRGPDYLRVQLEKARDFATLRQPSQLLQSEGFYASFFFLVLMRGEIRPSEREIDVQQEKMLRATQAMFRTVKATPDTPWLLHLVIQYAKLFPDERAAIVDALNDLSRGVFVDPGAAAMWRQHYLAALQLDLKNLKREEILAARKRWRDGVLVNPEVLFSRLGPQLRCSIPQVTVKIEALGSARPLVFDVNSVQEPVIRLVPGIKEDQVARWTEGRPFVSYDAFQKATSVSSCQP